MKSQLSVSGAATGSFCHGNDRGSREQRGKGGIQRREAKGKMKESGWEQTCWAGTGAEDHIRMNTVLHSQTREHSLLWRQDFFHSIPVTMQAWIMYNLLKGSIQLRAKSTGSLSGNVFLTKPLKTKPHTLLFKWLHYKVLEPPSWPSFSWLILHYLFIHQ